MVTQRKIVMNKIGTRLSGAREETSRSYLIEARARLTLRTVPTFVTAHTFCASRDTRVSCGWCLVIQGYFCAV